MPWLEAPEPCRAHPGAQTSPGRDENENNPAKGKGTAKTNTADAP